MTTTLRSRILNFSTLAISSLALSACAQSAPTPNTEAGPDAPATGGSSAAVSCADAEAAIESQPNGAGIAETTPEWVASHKCPGLTIVDVRTEEEVATGMIEGAKHIPVDELEGRLGELDASRPTVFVCRSGGRSAKATKIAADAGFGEVASMAGGMNRWKSLELPTQNP